MFLAIVNDTYSEVKSSFYVENSHLWSYIVDMIGKSRCCKRGKSLEDKKKEEQEGNVQEQVPKRPSRKSLEPKQVDNKQVMKDLFKVVEQKDSDEFQKLAKRVAIIEGSMERLHERFDFLIVRLRHKQRKKQRHRL